MKIKEICVTVYNEHPDILYAIFITLVALITGLYII